jgi:hypothetical protein
MNRYQSKDVKENAEAKVATLSAEEAEWEEQMRQLEEVDKWNKKVEDSMPEDLKPTLLALIKRFPGLQRMPAYYLMGHFEWNHDRLSELSGVLHKIPFDAILISVDFFLTFVEEKLHYLLLNIFHRLKAVFVTEWTKGISLEEGHYLIQVARHQSEVELNLMIATIESLNVKEMINMIKYVISNPKVNQCQLCKQKRLYNLEFRMRTSQIPPNSFPIPAIMPDLEKKADIWSAGDEKLFSFDTTLCQIYWNKRFPVNLVEICDKCLMDANEAISNKGR